MFWDKFSDWNHTSSIKLDLLRVKLQESTCLYALSLVLGSQSYIIMPLVLESHICTIMSFVQGSQSGSTIISLVLESLTCTIMSIALVSVLHPCVLSAGVTDLHHCDWLFHGFWSLSLLLQSCSKHGTHWPMFPALYYAFKILDKNLWNYILKPLLKISVTQLCGFYSLSSTIFHWLLAFSVLRLPCLSCLCNIV